MAKDFRLEEAVAALRREFADGLPARLEVLRAALDALGGGVTPERLRAFHLPAHALQGTAASYEAHELVPAVARLATLGRRWVEAGAAPGVELAEATRELAGLQAAVERYRERVAQERPRGSS